MKTPSTTTIVLTAAAAITVSAQNATYPNLTAAAFYTMIPSCAIPCNTYAFVHDTCAINNFKCHCSQAELIGELIVPCLANSTCTATDLTTIRTLVSGICAYEYANATTTTTTTNATATYAPVMFTGAASSVAVGAVGALGLVAAAAAFLL